MRDHPLRDLRRNTELLMLVEFIRSPSTKMREIAGNLGITVQAVSQYVAAMKREGLLTERDGIVKVTRKGMQIAQEHFLGLKQEIDDILRRIAVIDSCVAIAGEKVAKGQKVGLVMEDGMLMAYPNKRSPSTGRALEAAAEGDDLLVGQLEGIVDLELGKLLLVEAPAESEGGSKSANVGRVRYRIEQFSPGLLVAGDATGSSLLAKATEEMFTIHAPIESAMSALSKGVDVVFCGTRESMDRMLDAVSSLRKETGYEISWKTIKG